MMEEKTFTITEVAKYSGVQVHTLRAWEERYNLFTPDRKSGKNRTYDFNDFTRALRYAALRRNGIKLEPIRLLSGNALESLMSASTDKRLLKEHILINLMLHLHSDSWHAFDILLNKAEQQMNKEDFIRDILYRLLDLSGLFCKKAFSFDELLVARCLRNRLVHCAESTLPPQRFSSRILICSLEKTPVEFLHLYVSYLLRRKGSDFLDAGTQLNLEDVLKLLKKYRPQVVIMTHARKTSYALLRAFEELDTDFQPRFIQVTAGKPSAWDIPGQVPFTVIPLDKEMSMLDQFLIS